MFCSETRFIRSVLCTCYPLLPIKKSKYFSLSLPNLKRLFFIAYFILLYFFIPFICFVRFGRFIFHTRGVTTNDLADDNVMLTNMKLDICMRREMCERLIWTKHGNYYQ